MSAPHASQIHAAPPAEAELVTSQPRRSKWRRIRWFGGLVVVGTVFGLVIVGLLRLADGPVTAKAIPPKPSANPGVGSVAGVNTFSGAHVNFSYPDKFDSVSQLSDTASSLEQYILSSKTNVSHHIAVNVRVLPSGLLDDDPSYKFRTLGTSGYQALPDKLMGEPVVTMVKQDKTERTLFWAHRGKLLTIAVVSTDPHDDMAGILDGITKTLRWKQ